MTIAGSDPSGGAGIQQDLKTITTMGCYGATAITALTSQNTMGVQGVMPVPKEVVRSQMKSVMDDLDVAAIKIGMIPNVDIAREIVEMLRNNKGRKTCVVLDPVMVSTSGTRLMAEECIEYVKKELFPLCTLVTPNLPESQLLFPDGVGEMNSFGTSFLVKGGHADGEEMTDRLYCNDGATYSYSSKRISTGNLHGTGCTLSSAIACALADGLPLNEAVAKGKRYIDLAIEAGRSVKIGNGNGPLGIPEQLHACSN